MSISIVRRTRPVILQEFVWPHATTRFRLSKLVTCHLCHQPAAVLYVDEQTPGGACSVCKQREDWAEMEARWQGQEASDAESCCSCGCD